MMSDGDDGMGDRGTATAVGHEGSMSLRCARFWARLGGSRPLRVGRTSTPGTADVPGPGYVCFSAQDWWYHNRAHSDIQLLTRVAETRLVLFVNSIAMRMPLPGRSTKFLRRIVRKARSMAKYLQQPIAELPNFWIMTPVLLPLYGSPTARGMNARLIRLQIRWACRRIGIGTPIYIVTIPTAWEVVRGLPRRALIFNRSDKHSTFEEADGAYIASLERQLLTNADRVLYVSSAMMADDAAVAGDRAVFLDHGVDLEHFQRSAATDEPTDMRQLPHPRIGYFGGLDGYLVDFDLLYRLATEFPYAQLVLIGDASLSMKRFESLANVHWLGFRAYELIPRYGSGFDVAIMPWLRNDWITNSNPIKLKEYLALGLSVVSTDFPEATRYREFIRLASNDDEFVEQVRMALEDQPSSETRERRRTAVLGDSWERRTRDFIEISELAHRGVDF